MNKAVAQYLLNNFSKPIDRENSSDNTKVAVIVETRDHFFTPYVINNFSHFLDASWNIHKMPIQIRNGSLFEYNKMLLSSHFWNSFYEETILIFQTDTICFRKLDDRFLNYDFIGAPCKWFMNGGLSIRKKAAMLRCIKERSNIMHRCSSEDIFYYKALESIGGELPSMEFAANFSIETVLYQPEELPFGMHGTDKFYLDTDVIQNLIHKAGF